MICETLIWFVKVIKRYIYAFTNYLFYAIKINILKSCNIIFFMSGRTSIISVVSNTYFPHYICRVKCKIFLLQIAAMLWKQLQNMLPFSSLSQNIIRIVWPFMPAQHPHCTQMQAEPEPIPADSKQYWGAELLILFGVFSNTNKLLVNTA